MDTVTALNEFAEALQKPMHCHLCPEMHSLDGFREAHFEEYERLSHEAFLAARASTSATPSTASTDSGSSEPRKPRSPGAR